MNPRALVAASQENEGAVVAQMHEGARNTISNSRGRSKGKVRTQIFLRDWMNDLPFAFSSCVQRGASECGVGRLCSRPALARLGCTATIARK